MSRKAAVGYPWRRIGAIEAEVSAMNMKLIVARSLALGLLMATAAWGQESPPTVIPPPAVSTPLRSSHLQTADLAGGCYWGTQGIFEHIQGITSIVAGFSAGHSDDDGGAESVMITFDPKVISYGRLLQIFFSVVHDPTQLDRQGPDVGRGYRSDIFYVNDAQRRIAQAYIAQLDKSKVFSKPIRSDATRPPGPGRWPRLSVRHLLRERRAAPHRAGVHRAARQVQGVLQADRDPRRCPAGVQPGRAESTGLHDQESAPGLHPDQRRAEAGELEEDVSGVVQFDAAGVPVAVSCAFFV